jgi:hypothetical protein
MILLAVLFPPLYFLANKKFGMFVLTGFMFVVSLFLAMTVVLIPGSLILWFFASFPAIRHCRRRELEAHADMFTDKMAEKMRPQAMLPRSAPPPVPPHLGTRK